MAQGHQSQVCGLLPGKLWVGHVRFRVSPVSHRKAGTRAVNYDALPSIPCFQPGRWESSHYLYVPKRSSFVFFFLFLSATSNSTDVKREA